MIHDDIENIRIKVSNEILSELQEHIKSKCAISTGANEAIVKISSKVCARMMEEFFKSYQQNRLNP